MKKISCPNKRLVLTTIYTTKVTIVCYPGSMCNGPKWIWVHNFFKSFNSNNPKKKKKKKNTFTGILCRRNVFYRFIVAILSIFVYLQFCLFFFLCHLCEFDFCNSTLRIKRVNDHFIHFIYLIMNLSCIRRHFSTNLFE